MAPLVPVALFASPLLRPHPDHSLFLHYLVELSQVIKAHFPAPSSLPKLPAHIPEQPISYPSSRHFPQLLLYLLQGPADLSLALLQPHRIHRREPSYCPRQVHPFDQFFSPVPFQIYQHPFLSAPLLIPMHQGREQHIVDLRPIFLRHFFQQGLRFSLAQPHHHTFHAAHCIVCSICHFHALCLLHYSLPIFQLPLHFGRFSILFHFSGPLLQGAAFLSKLHSPPFFSALASCLQILQQDSP